MASASASQRETSKLISQSLSSVRANGKRANEQHGGQFKRKKPKKEKAVKAGSSEEVLQMDIQALVAARKDSAADNENSTEPLPSEGSEIDVEVVELSSTGDALALQKGSDQIYVVPFAVPGDTVRAKVFRHHPAESYSAADFVSVVKPSPLRDDSRVKCKYFARCSGCQFQMLDYAEQLRIKKTIVEKAYRNFSQLPAELIPAVLDTIGSPLEFGYRTKLTPHFDGPPGSHRRKGPKAVFESPPDVGFMRKGKRNVMDIEDCPIGTDAVRLGMKRERERLKDEYKNYHRGATILLRESTKRYKLDDESLPKETPSGAARVEANSHVDLKTCVTDNNAVTTEYIDDYVFTNPAGSFFQNNNSILPVFTAYVREHVLPPAGRTRIKHLIDAYSGSGLFTVTLSKLFQGSVGIDVAAGSIASARQNARLNNLHESQARFIAADAGELFKNVTYAPDETVVVLDPPRKGCDADFLGQLLRFGPRRVVYVSCNVHTQARDVGILVRGDGGDGSKYEIESLRGFDFFPQTGHVEGVAVLNRAG